MCECNLNDAFISQKDHEILVKQNKWFPGLIRQINFKTVVSVELFSIRSPTASTDALGNYRYV